MFSREAAQNSERCEIFFVGYAYDGPGPGNQHLTCSEGFMSGREAAQNIDVVKFFLWAMLMMGMDLKISI